MTHKVYFFFKVFTSKHSDFSRPAIFHGSRQLPFFPQLQLRLAVIVVRTGTLCLGG